MSRKWNFERHFKAVHRDTYVYYNSGVKRFEYPSRNLTENFINKKLGDYDNHPGFHKSNTNSHPYRSPLNSTQYESNLTHDQYPEFENKRKINIFKVSMILTKLNELRLQLISHMDVDRVNSILSYLYNECILQKSTKPIDNYLNLLPLK
jgi:hypothetical protein